MTMFYLVQPFSERLPECPTSIFAVETPKDDGKSDETKNQAKTPKKKRILRELGPYLNNPSMTEPVEGKRQIRLRESFDVQKEQERFRRRRQKLSRSGRRKLPTQPNPNFQAKESPDSAAVKQAKSAGDDLLLPNVKLPPYLEFAGDDTHGKLYLSL